MARILGVDLGAHTVKAVLFESAMRGYVVKSYLTALRGEGDRSESLRRALTELFPGGKPEVDQIVVSLPGPSLATHALTLPFVEQKRIEATLPFEVEGQLPVELKDVVYDYQLGLAQEKKSDLVVGVVRKDELSSLLELLHETGLDPRIVTHPALAYQNLLQQAPTLFTDVPEGQPVAIVDLGHERTCVAIGGPGASVEFARTFPGGGKELTRALSQELRISPEDAEQWKLSQGALAGQAHGPDAERAAGAFVRGLQPLLRELRQTFKAYAARSHRSVSAVYLCGGTSQLPGIEEQLTHELQLPCRLLPLPPEAKDAVPPETQGSAAQAYALALRAQTPAHKGPRFNFRRGEFAFKGDFDYLRERMGRLALFAATLLVLFIATGVVRNTMLGRQEQAVDDQLCEVTRRVLGQCEKNYDRALSMLRGKESPAAAVPKKSAVVLLAELTQRIPPEVPVELEQVVVDLSRISIRVSTDSSKQLDALTRAIKGHKCFKEISEGKLEKSQDGKKVKFRLDIDVACPEDGPAQGAPQG